MAIIKIGAEASVDFQKGIAHIEIEVDDDKILEEQRKWKELLNAAAFNQAKELADMVKLQKAMVRQ